MRRSALWAMALARKTRPMRLVQRMRRHRVPGSSVAVVDNGRIAWAKAWGVAGKGRVQVLDGRPRANSEAKRVSKPRGSKWRCSAGGHVLLQQLPVSFAATPIVLRGSMKGRGASALMRPVAPGRLATEVDLPAGANEFKSGSQDWQTDDLGAAFGPPGPLLGLQGPDLRLEVKKPGRWRFAPDVRNPAAQRYAVRRLDR